MNLLAETTDPLAPFMHALLWKAVPTILVCGVIGMILGDFRKSAKKWLERSVRRLVHGTDRQSSGAHPRPSPTLEADTPLCPACNASMVTRHSNRGAQAGKRLWGCSTYPACRGTRSIHTAEASA